MSGHTDDREAVSDEQSTPGSPSSEPTTLTVAAVLRATVDRLRSEPRLVAPFVLAGFVMAAVDVARRWDPIPASRKASDGFSVEIAFYLYPTGVADTARPLGAMVDLLPGYLLWAVGLELAIVLAVGVAGWAGISRGLDQSIAWRAAAKYVGLLVVPLWLARVADGAEIEFTNGGLIFGIPLLVVWALVLVRLFLLPVCLVDGRGVIEAVRESVRLSRGIGWTVFGLIVLIGLGTSLLGSVSTVGGLVSTALIAPLHAVAAVVVYSTKREGSVPDGSPPTDVDDG